PFGSIKRIQLPDDDVIDSACTAYLPESKSCCASASTKVIDRALTGSKSSRTPTCCSVKPRTKVIASASTLWTHALNTARRIPPKQHTQTWLDASPRSDTGSRHATCYPRITPQPRGTRREPARTIKFAIW